MEMPNDVKAVLIDLAGVLHTGDEALAGAVPALKRLRGAGLALRFLTNTTRTPGSVLFTKLCRMGFELSAGEIQTAALAARTVVRERGLRPHWMVHPNIAAEMGPDAAEPDVVVLGDMGEHFSYAGLNRAFRLLMQGCPLIAMARNRYFMESDGLALDMGAFVAGLEYSAGVKAEIVGKPAPAFFAAALAELGVTADQAVLIGDDLSDDIGGAQAAGLGGKAQALKQGVYASFESFQFSRQLGHIYIVVVPIGVAAFKFRSNCVERSTRLPRQPPKAQTQKQHAANKGPHIDAHELHARACGGKTGV